MTKNILGSNLQQRKSFYENEIVRIDQESAKKNGAVLEMKDKQEKLKKSKELLSQLFWLIWERSEKAKEIYSFINMWKNADSLMGEVKIINNNIKWIQQSLKSIQDISESMAICLLDILRKDVTSTEIEKVTEKIDKELCRISKLLADTLSANEENKALKMRYLWYILYVDNFLNEMKLMDSMGFENIMEADLVYNYAKAKWLNDVVERMKLRKLLYEEYEGILIKINVVYAYLVHMINISNSESECGVYYDLLDGIENWKITKNEREILQEKANQWLFYKGENVESVFDSFVKKSKETGEWLKYKIPDARDKKTSEMIEYMKQFVGTLEEKDINSNLVSELNRKWRGDIAKRNEKFANFRKEIEVDKVRKETFWVFGSYDDYENFKVSYNHSTEEALHLLKQGRADFLVHHLRYFKELSNDVLDKLLDWNGKLWLQKIVENYRSFWVNLDVFVLEVLDRWFNPNLLFVVINNEIFWSEVAIKIINLGSDNENLKELFKNSVKKRRFWWMNSDVALLIMNQRGEEWTKFVATHLGYFENLNFEVWDRLSRSDYYWLCSKYRAFFSPDIENRSDTQSVIKSIDEGFWWKVINNIDKYVWLDYKVVIDKLFEKGLWWFLGKKIDKFSMQFHMYVADKLVDMGEWWNLCKNIVKFKWLSDENIQTLAFSLIEKEQWWALAARLKWFKWLNHKIIADQLIACWQWKYVAKYWNNFEWLDESIVHQLGEIVKEIGKTSWKEIVSYFDFIPINDNETVKILVDSCPGAVVLYLHKFDKKYYKLIAEELISIGEARRIQQRFAKFEWLLDAEIANKLIELWFSEFVNLHAREFVWYKNTEAHRDSGKDIKKAGNEENIREFLNGLSDSEKETLLSSMHTYRNNYEWLNKKFKEQFGLELPKSWWSLILSLWWEKWCQKHDYLFALIKSRKDGARYLKKLKFPNGVSERERDIDWRMDFDDYKRYVGLDKIKEIVLAILNMDSWEKNVSFDERKFWLSEIEYWLNGCNTEFFGWERAKVIRWGGLRRELIEYAKKHFNTPKERIYFFKNLCEEVHRIAKHADIIDDESLNHSEEDVNNSEISKMDVLKERLRSVFSESFIYSLEIHDDWSIDEENLKASFDNEKCNFDEDCSFDFVCGLIEDAWMKIRRKDSEDWDIKEEYNKNNLWRIQRFLSVRDDFWEIFKSIIWENGEIKKQDLSNWIERTNFVVCDDFEIKLSHFWIKILDEEERIDFEFESGAEFVEKLELLGFECMNKDILIENIDKAWEIVVWLKSSLSTTLWKLYFYKNSGYIQEKTPFSKITPTNGNPKFSVIKYKRWSGKVPRFVFSNDEKFVMNIVPHEVYDRLRDGRKEKLELNGIEDRLFW